MLEVLLGWALPHRVIDGADGSPYLTRYTIVDLGSQIGRLYLHRFHRGDEDRELHSHPWRAISLILSGGYREERLDRDGVVRVRSYAPGAVNTISPSTFHRVDLINNEAWTLIAVGPVVGSWGFWDRETDEFTPWREFIARKFARPA